MEVLFRSPELSIEYFRLVVLDNTASPGRNAIEPVTGVMHLQAVKVSVPQQTIANRQFPLTIDTAPMQAELLSLPPPGQVSDQEDRVSAGSPFPENPIVAEAMHSKMLVPACKPRQVIEPGDNSLLYVRRLVRAEPDDIQIRSQTRVVCQSGEFVWVWSHAFPAGRLDVLIIR
jgi:hypothetical protein